MKQNDLPIELPGEPWGSNQESEATGMGNLAVPTSEVTKPTEVLTSGYRREPSFNYSVSDIIPRDYFLRHLQLEKRRTDRSKAPLSLVVLRLNGTNRDLASGCDQLSRVLQTRKRETDTLGYLDEGRFGVLLPDTSEEGTQGFVRKVVSDTKDLRFSVDTATYPDRLPDPLVTENLDSVQSDGLCAQAPDPKEGGYALKRSLDIVGALVGIVVSSPIMLLTAVVIALTSPGPIIFRQTRLGKGGAPFTFYKFRSMSQKADDRIHRDYVSKLISGDLKEVNQGSAIKPVFKMKSDPRITRVGKVIRKTSIDELPQLFNVLKGDMSLVGPRPPVSYEAERYQSWHFRRVLEIKPGITGLWQVEGRSRTTFDEMVRLDLRYIRQCSLLLDLRILLRTFKVVLRCDGAN